QKHWSVAMLALIIGLICVLPFLYFSGAIGDNYKGFFLAGSYDEEFYWGIVDQVRDGKSVDGNPYIYEQRDSGANFRYHPIEYVLGQVEQFASIDSFAVTTKFLFPAILAIAVYFLFIVLGLSRMGAVVGATIVLLGNELAPLAIGQIFKTVTLSGGPHSFLYYVRPVNPAVSAILFFGLLALFYRLFSEPSRGRAILLGAGVGLMTYIYFFYWNYLTILLGLIIILSICFKLWKLFRLTLLALLVDLLVSSPYLFKILHTFLNPSLDQTTMAKNFISTHHFIIEKMIIAPLLLLGILWFIDWYRNNTLVANPEKKPLIFVGLLLVTGLIASNQQVITGIEIQQFHYHFSTNIPAFLITMSLIFGLFLTRLPKKWQITLASLVVFIFVAHASLIQTYSYGYNFQETLDNQRYIPAFNWLNENTNNEDVVFTQVRLSGLLPIYTHNYVYGALWASAFPVPQERLEHNYFTNIAFANVTGSLAPDYFYDPINRNALGQYIFEGQYWRATCGSFGCFPDETLDNLILKYKQFLKQPISLNLKKYRADYVLWDLRKDKDWKLDQYKFLEKVFTGDEVSIYRVR
ncbi:MAG: hypothetical protein UU27_C0005G0022, partial [Parcubacteria group bacterium GW2011_GWD1_40_9]